MQPGEGVRSTDRAPLQGRERGGLRPSGPLVSLDHSDTWGHHLMKFLEIVCVIKRMKCSTEAS